MSSTGRVMPGRPLEATGHTRRFRSQVKTGDSTGNADSCQTSPIRISSALSASGWHETGTAKRPKKWNSQKTYKLDSDRFVPHNRTVHAWILVDQVYKNEARQMARRGRRPLASHRARSAGAGGNTRREKSELLSCPSLPEQRHPPTTLLRQPETWSGRPRSIARPAGPGPSTIATTCWTRQPTSSLGGQQRITWPGLKTARGAAAPLVRPEEGHRPPRSTAAGAAAWLRQRPSGWPNAPSERPAPSAPLYPCALTRRHPNNPWWMPGKGTGQGLGRSGPLGALKLEDRIAQAAPRSPHRRRPESRACPPADTPGCGPNTMAWSKKEEERGCGRRRRCT